MTDAQERRADASVRNALEVVSYVIEEAVDWHAVARRRRVFADAEYPRLWFARLSSAIQARSREDFGALIGARRRGL